MLKVANNDEKPNFQHWENLARLHGGPGDTYYDLDLLRAGGTLMGPTERECLDRATGPQGVAGMSVAHLQCHLACDAITLARAGARVTAIDFSPTALARAAVLAAECGVTMNFVEADSRSLPPALAGQFDYVYATIGVLCWIDDIDSWMRNVAMILRPGGRLVLVEMHPLHTMIDTVTPLVMDFPYNFDGPRVYESHGSYANRDAPVHATTHQYSHGLAEVVMAALHNDLAVVDVREHLTMSFNPRGEAFFSRDSDGHYRLRLGTGVDGQPAEPLPVLFSLIAQKA